MEKTAHIKKNHWHNHALSGFTIIELLVAIAIIGILASVVITSFSDSRGKSRDARRKEDLNAIRHAIELYYNTNNALPGSSGPGNCNSASGCNSMDAQPWIPGLVPQFIGELPLDPRNSATFKYRYRPTNTLDYEIDAPVEADFTSAANDGGNENSCPSQSTCRYEIGTDVTRLMTGP